MDPVDKKQKEPQDDDDFGNDEDEEPQQQQQQFQPLPQANPNLYEQLNKTHKFWETQPMADIKEIDKLPPGPLQVKKLEDVRKEPYTIPQTYEWCEVDLKNDEEAKQVYDLLVANYVEDDDNMFRFDYSIDFLRWALNPPGYFKDWIIGVKGKQNKKLYGFISGIPVHLVMEKEENKYKMTEINFLCVHKQLRTKRLAPTLIKEITRRVHLRNMWQAVYTAGVVLPTPVSQTRYYHRSLNPKKLIEVGFSSLTHRQTMSRQLKLYKLPEETKTVGLRAMKKKDIAQVGKLLNNYLKKFKLYFKFTDEEVKHFFLPRKDVIYSYVVENQVEIDGQKQVVVTDLISFYNLPSQVLKNPKYTHLRAAYSYYNVSTVTPLTQLMLDSLILAKNEQFDVFNALDIMENETFFKDLLFSPGDGQLNYYLYNWKLEAAMLYPKEVGIVLV